MAAHAAADLIDYARRLLEAAGLDAMIAVEFETPLVSDGAGGLCTRHRVSPYALAAAGLNVETLPRGAYPTPVNDAAKSKPLFMQVAATSGNVLEFPE